MRVLVFTGYSDDYAPGRICEEVNRAYAERHGYEWRSEVLPRAEMQQLLGPREFFGWFKVVLVRKYLEEGFDYLFWVDADAVVIHQEKPIDHLLEMCPGKDLIISEDLSKTCLLNSGVMLIKVSDWSRELWSDVWEGPKRHFTRAFYEQAALIHQLIKRKEDLNSIEPFHSFAGGPKIKLFNKVGVLSRSLLNSNKGLHGLPGEDEPCEFIFHVVGKANKTASLHDMLVQSGTPVPEICIETLRTMAEERERRAADMRAKAALRKQTPKSEPVAL